MRVVFSPAARDDLLEIADYIAQDNPRRAMSFVDELEIRCTALGGAPGIGTQRPELGAGVCAWPHGHYLIFYRTAKAVLRIERIMHGSRDIDEDAFAAR